MGSGQVLQCPYDFHKARNVVHEMAEAAALDLVSKKMVTDQAVLTVVVTMQETYAGIQSLADDGNAHFPLQEGIAEVQQGIDWIRGRTCTSFEMPGPVIQQSAEARYLPFRRSLPCSALPSAHSKI